MADAIPKINAVSQAKILVFSGPRETNLREAAILGGARGVVDKDAECETIVKAIRKVHEGEVWLDHAAAARVFAELSRRNAARAANPLAHGLSGKAGS